MLDELLEAYQEADEEDKQFIEDEFKTSLDLEHKAIYSNIPSWKRVRWGFEPAKSDAHFNECYKIWTEQLKTEYTGDRK